MSARDLLLAGFIIGCLPLAVISPHIGVLLWAWLGYMNPHRLTWGFAWSMPFAQLVAVATLAGLVISGEKKRVPFNRTTTIWLAFVAWASITTLQAINKSMAVDQWQQFIKIQLMTFVAIVVINSRQRLIALLWVIVLSLAFYGIKGGVFTIVTGGHYTVWGPPKSLIEGNNELAFALIIMVPLMRFLQLNTANRWLRYGLSVSMVLCGFSILGSQSRGALVAGGAMVAALWFRSRKKIVIGLAILVVGLALFQFAPEAWFARMSTIQTYEQDGSAMGRINAWWFAFNLAKSRPLFGGGFDAFTPDMFQKYAPDPLDFHDSHSIYFGVLGEHGFVGLSLFLALGFSALWLGNSVRRRVKDHPDLTWASNLAGLIQVSLIGYAVGGVFLGLAYFDLYYSLVAMLVILQDLVGESVQAERASAVRQEDGGKSTPFPNLALPRQNC